MGKLGLHKKIVEREKLQKKKKGEEANPNYGEVKPKLRFRRILGNNGESLILECSYY